MCSFVYFSVQPGKLEVILIKCRRDGQGHLVAFCSSAPSAVPVTACQRGEPAGTSSKWNAAIINAVFLLTQRLLCDPFVNVSVISAAADGVPVYEVLARRTPPCSSAVPKQQSQHLKKKQKKQQAWCLFLISDFFKVQPVGGNRSSKTGVM